MNPQPIRPQLAPTKPCSKCTRAFAYQGKERVCTECRGAAHRVQNRKWSSTRSDVALLRRQVADLQERIAAIESAQFNCRVRAAKEGR